MTGQKPIRGVPEPGTSLEDLQSLAEQSQRVVLAFWERQAKEAKTGGFSVIDGEGMAKAFQEFSQSLWSDPARLLEQQIQLWQANVDLARSFHVRAMVAGDGGGAASKKSDRRFKDNAWEENLVFNYLKQAYLVSSDWVNMLVKDTKTTPEAKDQVAFFTRQFLSAMAPSNFALTNPMVLEEVKKTGGKNLVDGFKNLLTDLEKGRGELKISMTNEAAFAVGDNVAVTPGKVIFQNDLMQLIQYAPATESVFKRPLLVVPPWINKFYVLDLQPRNSLVKWIVDQGYTLFVISWVNPREDLADKSFADYMKEGPLAALGAIEKAIGEREVNVLGFCIGGILTTATLAYLAAVGDDRIKSASLMATMVDLKDVGEVSVFVNDAQLRRIKGHVAQKGYLEGKHMADMFSMMRENDLIWSFVVNNYLLGKDPMPFDLLYWNSDSTRLPAEMLVYYIENFYLKNLLMLPGGIELAGVPLDLAKIKTPIYSVATRDDHIAPWVSCYPLTQATGGPVRFVLGGSGHIAGIVNPPASGKYGFWTNEKTPADPEAWLSDAKAHEGSWWTDWGRWLARKSGAKVGPRTPGTGGLKAIEDAPGTYVKVRNAN
ncbi:MAG: class I poly(R)-hydroxyalkanoic acid synthase [Rhodospirillales bacterium CG15_BIG_FIL_POST_REV_8_21_14_020_66_15]|nr:MAG: class I poly(R)-hydroxyalkanoic acid synthase [Rhodospirillales bacterium CG15_BIG_FIL_POST_REV_8_21_14_020_66_15]